MTKVVKAMKVTILEIKNGGALVSGFSEASQHGFRHLLYQEAFSDVDYAREIAAQVFDTDFEPPEKDPNEPAF